ncbi:MAG: hypothetical protein ACYC0V_21805, partial [Armatimonadota bacterium]
SKCRQNHTPPLNASIDGFSTSSNVWPSKAGIRRLLNSRPQTVKAESISVLSATKRQLPVRSLLPLARTTSTLISKNALLPVTTVLSGVRRNARPLRKSNY